MLKIGHRGTKGYEPENTLPSFQKALEMGVDGIELDVHLSSDNEIIVIHDSTLNRTTNGKGAVKNFSLKELKEFRIDGEHEIPLLREVLDMIDRRCVVNIEIKEKEMARLVIELIELYVKTKSWEYKQFLITSFNWVSLWDIHIANREIPLGILTEDDLDPALSFAKHIHAQSIHSYFRLLTKENTARIQEEGFQVFAWTVNTLKDIQKIKSFHVNGIITDFPDRI